MVQHDTTAIVSGCRRMEKWTGEKDTARQGLTKKMKKARQAEKQAGGQWQDRQCYSDMEV